MIASHKSVVKIAGILEEDRHKFFARINEIADFLNFGNFGKRRKGIGDDFWQFRKLQLGESANKIDWRQTAKTNHVFVKEKESRNPKRFQFWIDANLRMRWSSTPQIQSKVSCAQTIAIGIYIALHKIGQQPILLGHVASPVSIDELLGLASKLGTSPPQTNKAGAVILFSDGLDDVEIWRQRIKKIISKGGQPLMVIIQDPLELSLDLTGRAIFTSLEADSQEVEIEDCQSIRKAYLARYESHFSNLRELANEMQMPIFFHLSGTDYLPTAKSIWQSLETQSQRKRAN